VPLSIKLKKATNANFFLTDLDCQWGTGIKRLTGTATLMLGYYFWLVSAGTPEHQEGSKK